MGTGGHRKHISVRTRNRARGAGVLLALSTVLAAAGCTSNTESPDNNAPMSQAPSATTSATPPPDPTEAAKKEAIAAYEAYWKEMERVYATASLEGTDITRYAAGPALSRPRLEAEHLRKVGRVFTGRVGLTNSTVTHTELGGKVPGIRLSSCLDVSAWKVKDTKTNKPVATPTNHLTKYVIVTTVERWKDGWKVIKDEPQERAC